MLSTYFISQQMHAHWESCNKSALWSMKSEKADLVDAIIVTIVRIVSLMNYLTGSIN